MVACREIGLSLGAAALRRFLEPLQGFLKILLDAFALEVAVTQLVLCLGVSFFRRLLVPFHRHGVVAGHLVLPFVIVVALGQHLLRRHLPEKGESGKQGEKEQDYFCFHRLKIEATKVRKF